MNHPREPYDRLFDRFDDCFATIAEQEGLCFERRAGPNLGRALRMKDDPFKRGVFLELKYHWSKSDQTDPLVTLGYGAWLRPGTATFPLHVLTKVHYDGKMSGIKEENLAATLKTAVAEVKEISKEEIIRDGKVFTDWPKDGKEAGSYYE